MKPLVTSRPLADYTPKKQKQLCTCTPQCKNIMLIVREEFAYQVCEKGTQAFAYELLKELGRIADPTRLRVNHWTTLQIQQLKDYVLAFGAKVPNGAYTEFAAMVNKDRRQVKDKVHALRKSGELPPVPKDETEDSGKK